MSWLLLLVAGIFEAVWAIGLKYSDGFTRLWPSVGTLAAMIVSFLLLSWALKSLPIGTAYSVWVGVGAVAVVLAGIVLFQESLNPVRLASIGLILAGVIGLKLSS